MSRFEERLDALSEFLSNALKKFNEETTPISSEDLSIQLHRVNDVKTKNVDSKVA